ncbi:MAG: hypothetical protein AABY01_02745, partial [Nanoarchaeota archaeon]
MRIMALTSSYLFIDSISNLTSNLNANINLPTTGTTITRNIADANIALIVDLVHASATGDVLELRAASSPVLSFDRTGGIIFNGTGATVSTNYETRRLSTNILATNVPTGASIQHFVNGSIVAGFDVNRLVVAEIGQIGSAANSLITLATTGMTLHRNIADANTSVIIKQDHASSTGAILQVKNDTTTTLTIAQDGGVTLAPEAQTSGAPDTLTVTGAAHTSITAATEDMGVLLDFSATKTWAAGAGPLATQREISIAAPTYNGNVAGALTITDAATVYISGAPVQGTNITLSNTYALWVDSGITRLDGAVTITDATITSTKSSAGAVLQANITATAYTTGQGIIDLFRTGALTGVGTETITDFNESPSFTLTQPAADSVTYIGVNVDLGSVAVTAGAGDSDIYALRLNACSDADSKSNLALL